MLRKGKGPSRSSTSTIITEDYSSTTTTTTTRTQNYDSALVGDDVKRSSKTTIRFHENESHDFGDLELGETSCHTDDRTNGYNNKEGGSAEQPLVKQGEIFYDASEAYAPSPYSNIMTATTTETGTMKAEMNATGSISKTGTSSLSSSTSSSPNPSSPSFPLHETDTATATTNSAYSRPIASNVQTTSFFSSYTSDRRRSLASSFISTIKQPSSYSFWLSSYHTHPLSFLYPSSKWIKGQESSRSNIYFRKILPKDRQQIQELHEAWFPVTYQEDFYDQLVYEKMCHTGEALYTNIAATTTTTTTTTTTSNQTKSLSRNVTSESTMSLSNSQTAPTIQDASNNNNNADSSANSNSIMSSSHYYSNDNANNYNYSYSYNKKNDNEGRDYNVGNIEYHQQQYSSSTAATATTTSPSSETELSSLGQMSSYTPDMMYCAPTAEDSTMMDASNRFDDRNAFLGNSTNQYSPHHNCNSNNDDSTYDNQNSSATSDKVWNSYSNHTATATRRRRNYDNQGYSGQHNQQQQYQQQYQHDYQHLVQQQPQQQQPYNHYYHTQSQTQQSGRAYSQSSSTGEHYQTTPQPYQCHHHHPQQQQGQQQHQQGRQVAITEENGKHYTGQEKLGSQQQQNLFPFPTNASGNEMGEQVIVPVEGEYDASAPTPPNAGTGTGLGHNGVDDDNVVVATDTIVACLVGTMVPANRLNSISRQLLLPELHRHSKAFYIMTLGTVKDYRKAGLASSLIDQCIQRVVMNDKQCGAVYLHVITTNQSAIRFYERLGFWRVQEIQDYYNIEGNNYNCYLYAKYFHGNRGHLDIFKVVSWWLSSIWKSVKQPLSYLVRSRR